MNAIRLALPLCLILSVACEKEGGSGGKASGKLDDSERAMLANLPAGASLVFGGNYNKFVEYWETSPIKRLAEASMSKVAGGSGMSDYMDCWVKQAPSDIKLAGSLDATSGISFNMVFVGLTADLLAKCADKGAFTIKKDSDGRYVELEGIPNGVGGTTSAGYFFINPKTAFFAMDVNMMTLASGGTKTTRAQLEAKLAQAKSHPAINDPAIAKMIESADRSKALWISGSAANTPLADKLGSGHGWFDVEKDAIRVGFSIELANADTASKAVSDFNKMKSEISKAPPQLREAVEGILKDVKLSASGKTLSGQIRLTNAVLDKALPALKAFGGGM